MSVDEEELVECIIDGIPDIPLRNQARLQRFDSKSSLLTAFENISLRETASKSTRASTMETKGSVTNFSSTRDKIAAGSTSKREPSGTMKNSMGTLAKIRCYNCSKYEHTSKECKLPQREKGTCFKCSEKGHVMRECKSKTIALEVNCIT